MKKLLTISIIILCISCAINLPEPTIYFMGISEDEFKIKNDGLELIEQNEYGVVYIRKECDDCNPQYYTFIYGKLEAVTPFHAGLDKMQFDLKLPELAEPIEPEEPIEPQEPKEPLEGVMPIIPDVQMPVIPEVKIPEIPETPEPSEQPEPPEEIEDN